MKICKPLPLEEYRSIIDLDKPYKHQVPAPDDKQKLELIVDDLLAHLYSEFKNEKEMEALSYEMKRKELYSLLTIRKPKPLPNWFHKKLGSLLQRESNHVDIDDISLISQQIPESNFKVADKCALWMGDITRLKCDAIVNAANKHLLGCFRAFHKCIDNAIHSAAGPMLREDCNKIIKLQGCTEGTGWAKITRAYNLPSKFVLHTVGPIYDKSFAEVSRKLKQELADCYISCLDLASQIPSIRTIAFCSISTGEFGFPMELATRIALKTIEEWVENNHNAFDLIIFDVFSEKDYNIYNEVLKGKKSVE